jgi:transposase
MSSEPFRKPYPSDASPEAWALAAPYWALVGEDAPPREHNLREGFKGRRYLVKGGCRWRYLATNGPPWRVVEQPAQRWITAGVLASRADDLRALWRLAAGRQPAPCAALLDRRTLSSTPESGARAGYDGAKRRKGSKLPGAVDTPGHLLARPGTPANEQDRAQAGVLCEQIQQAAGATVEWAYLDQGDTGETAAPAAQQQGSVREVVKLAPAKKRFILLPRRWVVERCFAGSARLRRLIPIRFL